MSSGIKKQYLEEIHKEFGAYANFVGPTFLSCLRRVFEKQEEYEKYNFSFIYKVIKNSKIIDDNDKLLKTLKDVEFWNEIRDVQKCQVWFDVDDPIFKIMRCFFDYFFKNVGKFLSQPFFLFCFLIFLIYYSRYPKQFAS